MGLRLCINYSKMSWLFCVILPVPDCWGQGKGVGRSSSSNMTMHQPLHSDERWAWRGLRRIRLFLVHIFHLETWGFNENFHQSRVTMCAQIHSFQSRQVINLFLSPCYNYPGDVFVEHCCLTGRGSLAAAPQKMVDLVKQQGVVWPCSPPPARPAGTGPSWDARTDTAAGRRRDGSEGSRRSHSHCQLLSMFLTHHDFFLLNGDALFSPYMWWFQKSLLPASSILGVRQW